MFERPESGTRAVLVQLDFRTGAFSERLSEVELLAGSAGAVVVARVSGRRRAPDPALFAGKGKVQEIADAIRDHGADLAIFNHELSPGQQRNLERTLNCRVIDRNALILDIFALRAKSHEGKLQVELAQLQHLSTRLIRGWTHLERQRAGSDCAARGNPARDRSPVARHPRQGAQDQARGPGEATPGASPRAGKGQAAGSVARGLYQCG